MIAGGSLGGERAAPAPWELKVGEGCSWNFGGSPKGSGTFRGWTTFGWLAIEQGGVTAFYNPALLCTITPLGKS